MWAHRWYWTVSFVSHRILFCLLRKVASSWAELILTIHGWKAQSIYPKGKNWRFYLWSFLLMLRVCCSQLQPFRSCEGCFTPRRPMQQSSAIPVQRLSSHWVCCILAILWHVLLRVQELTDLERREQPLEDGKVSLKNMWDLTVCNLHL